MAALLTPDDVAAAARMVALKGKPDIGDRINDPGKLGSGKELVQRLTDLIAIFEGPALDFSKNRADGEELLGDVYEYLMRHFATESGKGKGQFCTPAEVSRVMARLLGIRHAKVTSRATRPAARARSSSRWPTRRRRAERAVSAFCRMQVFIGILILALVVATGVVSTTLAQKGAAERPRREEPYAL